jgi:AraC-like DNA-binding protein
MLYDCKNPICSVVGVEHLSWRAGDFDIQPRDHSALAFRLQGTASIVAAGKEYFVDTGDLLYLPQNLAYTARYTDTEMMVIHFKTARDDPEPQVFSFSESGAIYKNFLAAHTLWKNKAPGHPALILSLLYEILGLLWERRTLAQVPALLLKAVSFINHHFRETGLSVGDICANVGISATYLRQFFKKYYHKTPIEYIIELRLEYARQLISCGATVEQAATESGFSDSKYFARTVKKRFGCTPREWRIYGK